MKNSLYTVIVILLLFGCRNDNEQMQPPPCDDPTNIECPNYDPCFDKLPTTSDFIIAAQFGILEPWSKEYYEDTLMFGGKIRFAAIDTTATKYTWYIGSEIISGGTELRTIERSYFLPPLLPGVYSTTLVVHKTADSTCFPNDSGQDSLTKFFYLEKDGCKGLTYNKFKGVFEETPSDSVVIELMYAFNRVPVSCTDNNRALHAVNFFGNQDTINFSGSIVGGVNRRIEWFTSNPNSDPLGYLDIDSLNIVRAEYEFVGIRKKFTGRILN